MWNKKILWVKGLIPDHGLKVSKCCALPTVLWLMSVFICLITTNTCMRALKARLYATRPNLNDRAGMLGSYLLHILLYRQFGHWGTLLDMMYYLEILYWVMEY